MRMWCVNDIYKILHMRMWCVKDIYIILITSDYLKINNFAS